jgi:hypothetical protein
MKSSNPFIGSGAETQATGCSGAGSYRAYAQKLGFKYIEVVNWCSSAGDWEFIISKDGNEWFVLNQVNNYPRPGFSHSIFRVPYWGTAEQVLRQLAKEY